MVLMYTVVQKLKVQQQNNHVRFYNFEVLTCKQVFTFPRQEKESLHL
jgi:hypothetical protein